MKHGTSTPGTTSPNPANVWSNERCTRRDRVAVFDIATWLCKRLRCVAVVVERKPLVPAGHRRRVAGCVSRERPVVIRTTIAILCAKARWGVSFFVKATCYSYTRAVAVAIRVFVQEHLHAFIHKRVAVIVITVTHFRAAGEASITGLVAVTVHRDPHLLAALLRRAGCACVAGPVSITVYVKEEVLLDIFVDVAIAVVVEAVAGLLARLNSVADERAFNANHGADRTYTHVAPAGLTEHWVGFVRSAVHVVIEAIADFTSAHVRGRGVRDAAVRAGNATVRARNAAVRAGLAAVRAGDAAVRGDVHTGIADSNLTGGAWFVVGAAAGNKAGE